LFSPSQNVRLKQLCLFILAIDHEFSYLKKMFIFIFVFVFVLDAPVTEEKEGDNLARLLSWSIGKNNFEGTERKKERKKTEKNILRDKSVSVSVKQQKKCSIQTLNISQLLFFRLWSFWNVRLLSWNQYFNIFFKTISYFVFSFYDLGYEEKGSIGEKNI